MDVETCRNAVEFTKIYYPHINDVIEENVPYHTRGCFLDDSYPGKLTFDNSTCEPNSAEYCKPKNDERIICVDYGTLTTKKKNVVVTE